MGMGGALQQGYNPQGMYDVVYNPETESFENNGKDVHHKDRNPKNNKRKNLSVLSKSKNRSFRRT